MVGTRPHPLEFLFQPRSIAVAGVSAKEREWGGGAMFLRALEAAGFEGPIYAINPRAPEVLGRKAYASLTEIPGPVDYVISSIPFAGVLQLVDDAAAKGVRAIHFFTAGFRETGVEGRVDLERQVLERARAAGIRLIGPNCMGLYCPAAGISFNADFPKEAGSVAFVSQSGLNAQELVTYSALRGVRFSKVISYGNAADLDECDFFDYCTADPQTKIITSYVEGVKDGQRFLRALRAAAATKPTIVLKGGVTAAGAGAALSHTGSLAGSSLIWDALCRQTGALGVESLDELEDMAVSFLFLKPPVGRGVAIIVVGGGTSVLAADAAEKEGLTVPPISPDRQQQLREFTPLEGSSVLNPLDAVAPMRERDLFRKMVRIVSEQANIHALLILTRIDWGARPGQNPEQFVQYSVQTLAACAQETAKPMAVALRPPTSAQVMGMILDFQRQCAEAGLAVYPDIVRGLRAIFRYAAWQEQRGEG